MSAIVSPMERLLNLMGRNKLLVKIARKVLLSYYIRKGFEKIHRFYAVARLEEGLDPFFGGYYSRPKIEVPLGHVMNIEVCEKNLLDIKGILDKARVNFWLMFGTFLGAYRDQAIIPYDVDIDLAIYSEDLPRLVGCEDLLAKEGFQLGVNPIMATLCRDGQYTEFYCFHFDSSKRVFESIKYDVNAFETFNEIPFLGQNWRILSEPERWLKYTYGEDWKTPIKGKGVGKGCAYGEEFESTREMK